MTRSALKVAGIYVAIGAVGILLARLLVVILGSRPDAIAAFEFGKDWFMLLLTAALLTWLINREIIARERTKEDLRQSQARFAGVIASAMDAIISVDADQRVVLFNHAAEQMFGWPAAKAIGQPLDAFLPERYRKHHRDLVEEFGRTKITRRRMGEYGAVTGLRANGQEFPLEASISQLDVGGRKLYSAILRDITEKKRLEAQFLRAQRLESIGTLAGGIAHDLNNILTPMAMAVKLLKRNQPEPQRQGLLATLQSSVERAAELVKQVLAFAGGVEGGQAIVSIGEVIGEVQTILRHTLPKTIALQISLTDSLWNVRGDATQFSQIFMNLCVNARDAMPRGGTLTISATNAVLDENYARMQLEAKPGPYVHITVADTGTGIAPNVMEKMFDPFYTTKEKGKGTGLGLSTALGIVRSHGGFMTVYSEPGKGASFNIYLPAVKSPATQQALEQQRDLPLGHGELILIVDDEAPILEVARATLEAHGYRALTAGDGRQAVELYREKRQEVNAVLLDMMMPVMDGPATLQALKEINPDVRVIATSGLPASGKAEAVTTSAQAFLPKPYTAENLLQLLGRIVASP